MLRGSETKPKPVLDHPITETHYTPLQLGKAWGLSAETIRGIFKDEPGVLRIGPMGHVEDGSTSRCESPNL
jgi:hypothetical protein